MNIKKIFNGSAEDMLTKKKSDFLEDLEKEAEKIIMSKKDTVEALKAAQEELALKVSQVGQAKTLGDYEKAKEEIHKDKLVYELLMTGVKVKRLNSEISDLESIKSELFDE